jgi:predicted kinase
MQAIIFIGIHASGKSTCFQERFANTHIRLNLDMLHAARGSDSAVRLS